MHHARTGFVRHHQVDQPHHVLNRARPHLGRHQPRRVYQELPPRIPSHKRQRTRRIRNHIATPRPQQRCAFLAAQSLNVLRKLQPLPSWPRQPQRCRFVVLVRFSHESRSHDHHAGIRLLRPRRTIQRIRFGQRLSNALSAAQQRIPTNHNIARPRIHRPS